MMIFVKVGGITYPCVFSMVVLIKILSASNLWFLPPPPAAGKENLLLK